MGLKRWWRRNFAKDKQAFRNDEVIEAYIAAGCEIGQAVSYIYMGECVGFDKLLDQWETTEKAYSALGYRTLSIDDFTGTAWGHSIDELVRVPRKEGEPEVFHAAFYREHFFQKVGMNEAVIKAMSGEAAVGHYAVPSTEHLKQG
jgi:hypothetical protein